MAIRRSFCHAQQQLGRKRLHLTDAQTREILAHVLDTEPDEVNASELRRRLREKASTLDWLHPSVAARIRELGLYGPGPEGPPRS